MEGTIKVFLVDDHPIVRQGLARLIAQESGMTVCGEAEDAPAALRGIDEERPDIAIIDLSLRSGDGIELIKSLRFRFPDLPVLVLTMHEEFFYAERALRAGALGFLTKQEASDNVLTAIRKLLDGEIYVSDRLSPRLLKRLLTGEGDSGDPPVARLSDRELQVFKLIGLGRGTQEIADALHLSVKTIETYRAHIKDKLDLRDARELLQYAIRWSLSQGKG